MWDYGKIEKVMKFENVVVIESKRTKEMNKDDGF